MAFQPLPRREWFSALWRLAAVFGSGLLLASAFPPLADAQAAWVALVPLLLVARFSRLGEAFGWGWLGGLAFWSCSVSWLLCLGGTGPPWPVAALGWLLLSAYCALYTGAFTMCMAWAFRPRAPAGGREPFAGPVLRNVGLVCVAALLWVGFEYLRSTLCGGFPWNPLGVSQYRNLPLIQLAEWGGVYAVSALVAAVNAAVALMGLRMADIYLRRRPARLQLELMVGLALVASAWLHGVRRVRFLESADAQADPPVRIAAVQPNVPQLRKWPAEFAAWIRERLESRMELVRLLAADLDLVVWPETAVPGVLPGDAETETFIRQIARETGLPILVGALELEVEDGTRGAGHPEARLYNSSFLYGGDGDPIGRYRKIHLVPFGEYVPFDKALPFLRRFEPLGFSCWPGREHMVFRLPPAGLPAALRARRQPLWRDSGEPAARQTAGGDRPASFAFSVLICFEDAFPPLARAMVRSGARLLVNQTNDAWFDGSAAAVQHMAHCVFRCVENRVPAVRAGNTGVTCFIDSTGRIDETTLETLERGEWPQTAYRTGCVRPAGERAGRSFYARHGDRAFAAPCAAVCAALGVWLAWRAARERTTGGAAS